MKTKEKKFSIVVWESNEDRDIGESFVAEMLETEQEAIERAKQLFYRMGYAAIEVLDEDGNDVFGLYDDDDDDDDDD